MGDYRLAAELIDDLQTELAILKRDYRASRNKNAALKALVRELINLPKILSNEDSDKFNEILSRSGVKAIMGEPTEPTFGSPSPQTS